MRLDKHEHGGRVLLFCLMLLVIGPWLMWSTRADFRAAEQRYVGLLGAEQLEYRVADKWQEERGGGRSRSTHYFAQLTPGQPRRDLAAGVTVEISGKRFDLLRSGERWVARMQGSQPVFDPMETRFEFDRRSFGRIAGVISLLLVLLLGLGHASGRLYRPLW